jgi:hypothetical protein
MAPRQIIVIRHAQKPTAKPRRRGVREDGTNDRESLTVSEAALMRISRLLSLPATVRVPLRGNYRLCNVPRR